MTTADPHDQETSTLTHEDALAALAKVSDESDRYAARVAEAEARWAELADDTGRYESAQTQHHDLLRENVALVAGLPPELGDALRGETREELEAHAKVLARFVPGTVQHDDADDPRNLARELRAQTR